MNDNFGGNPPASTKYNGLDVTKFIMAIFIVMMHSSFIADYSYNLHYLFQFAITRIAVPFFFIASGFLLYRKINIDNIDFSIVKKYIKHILTIYFVWTIIYFPFILRDVILKNPHGTIRGFLFFIYSSIVSGSYYHLWFLQALIVASIIVTALLYFKYSIKSIFILAVIMYGISLLGQSYYWIFDYYFPEGTTIYSLFNILHKLFITPRDGLCFGFLFFFIGVYISQSPNNINNPFRGMLISFILLIFEVMFGSFYNFNSAGDVYISLVPLSYYVFLYAQNIKLRDSSCWAYLRKQSMYIYYIHPYALFIAGILGGTDRHSLIHLGHLGVFGITLLLSILFGHIIIQLRKGERHKFLKYLS